MSRARFVLLALVAVVAAGLLGAGQASAATTVIQARDDGGPSRWVPPDVTVQLGDTVEWNFDDALVQHDVQASSPNWDLSTETLPPDAPPVSVTFDEPGTYTFLCSIHGPSMSGSVTVEEGPALSNVLVVSKTARFRHDSIPQGIQAIQELGAANGFTVDVVDGAMQEATSDPQLAAAFTDANLAQYDVVVFLSTTGDFLTVPMQEAFERYIEGGGGFAGVHAASDTEYTWPWYGQLVGGYFRNHPAGTPTAEVDITDGDEPSTSGLPASWTRTDEWYNFQDITEPVVNGSTTVADFSPRASHVHVLATVDESSYAEDDGNAIDDDHPIAWCSDFDGGRSWYTGMGHTQASFADANFRSHLLGGLRTAAGVAGDCGPPREVAPTAADFEKVILNNDTNAPMEIDVASDGRAFYIELDGRVQMWSPTTRLTTTVATLPVSLIHENGLIGIQLAPDFATTGHIYLAYATLPDQDAGGMGTNRVSRFTLTGNTLGQEQIIYTWRHQREECCHTGGSLDFGPDGSLYLSTGDNSNPFAHGYNPTDERPGRENWDAQRTSANSNDPNGKILRIMPIANASGAPGIGTTYTIPAGNLFDEAQDTQGKTLPEIYAMGFRNPFRIHVDQKTGWVLMGDYGPDAGSADPRRGPQGSVEFNVVKEPGFYGWPYCIRENVPYHDITYASDNGNTGTDNGTYNCNAPVNDSPNNTGLTNLPAAIPASMWMAYTEADARFPGLGTGGAPTGGARYYYDEGNPSTRKFPRFYDGQWFIGEWNNDWVKNATINDQGLATGVSCFAVCTGYISPMDLEFGPDGSLYVVEWGQGFAENNPDSGVYRIDYVKGDRLPIARAAADPDSGTLPLAVQFSSTGSVDPDGTDLTYAWDFGDGGTSTDPNPTHTYTAAGTYEATLTVTDESRASGVDSVTVIAGNSRPQVTIEIPENGRIADFGDKIPYRISVTDAEDGSTGSGIACADIRIEFKLGHDTHAHELSSTTGCQGEFTLTGVDGHGVDANVFTVITARYTDKGAGPAGAVTGTAEAILQPKLKQAEYWATTGRTADSRATSGDPGVANEATTDVGGGNSAAFIEDGDWISFNPYNLEDLSKVTFRVASAGAGGIIELRYDSADGPLVAATPNIAPTGGWQTWTDVTMNLPASVPQGTHRLFLVFRHPTATGSLMNLNWFKFTGKGAAVTAPPEVSAAAEPTTGEAPLDVAFDATATDAEGEALTYAWNFGVPGTTEDTSTEEDPTYRYATPGNYTATVTATDASGGKASASVEVRVTRPLDECPTGPVRSDEFDGDALDTDRWTVIRPDAANPFSVSDGNLNLPIANGSIYAAGTTAKNIIVQSTPDGAWSATAKISTTGLTENYHQAGLRVYSDDDNWASVHMIFAGTSRDIEFIYEANGQPRNEGADKLGGIPATAPDTYYVRITSDGTQLTASYSYDGTTFNPVGRPAPLSTFTDPKIGPAALSDAAPTVPMARFDWIRFDPDGTGGSGSEPLVDDFDGSALDPAWTVERQDQSLLVSGGRLQIPAAPGDIYQTRNDARNLVMRAAPDGPWVATAKLNFEGTAQYHQAGIMVYGDDANFTKFGRIAHTAAGDEKFEFINEVNSLARNDAADSTANIPEAFPDDFWVRLTSDGTSVTGAYSTDGTSWTPVGRAALLPADAKIGLFAFSNDATGNPVAAFDSFTLAAEDAGGGGGTPAGPSRDDQFDGGSLDKTRWNAIVRDTPAEYNLSGGRLNITTSPGDIYTTPDTNPPPNNFILQSADHAGADWVIETKLSGTINGGYAQGGLLAYQDGDNYVKLDAISDTGNTRINRIELRSEVAGAIANPQPQVDVPVGTTDIWLRLTKTGTSYAGQYSFDGVAWVPIAQAVAHAMAAPRFGLFAFGPQADGQGDLVSFDYFTLDGEDTGECSCVSSGDEFGAAALDKTRWNGIIREDATKYELADGALRVTTVGGDIYSGPDTAVNTRNFMLQTPDHAGADWVIETKVGGAQLSGGYEHAGLLAYQDDGDYVKYDLISDDGQTAVNRIELRSEENDVVQNPQPQFATLPPGTTDAWLRLTKTGDVYKGEYSFDGQTWAALSETVQNDMAEPRFGLFTQGVNSPGSVVTFDYFSVDGERGCPGEEPQNAAPVLADPTATPTSGFAPLAVAFTASATDADEDPLTYSWDFDGDGTADSSAQNPSHTYTAAGTYNARVTVSDGEASASKTVTVSVLGAADPAARFRVLVFSKTAGFRHSSIDEGIAAIRALGTEHDFQVDATEDATAFRPAVLSQFDTVVFLSTTGDVLNDAQQAAFEDYVGAGGGYTGIHAASDTEYTWPWYGRLVGAYFRNHPANQDAEVRTEPDAHDHAPIAGLPASYTRLDEWYNFQSPENPVVGGGGVDFSPRPNVHVLENVNEASYAEDDGNTTDDDHPVTWCQRYDGGRSFYTAMGHVESSFDAADDNNILTQILGGLEVTAGVVPDPVCGVEPAGDGPVVQAFADPSSGTAPLSVNFSATGLDPDGGEIAEYKWTFSDGGTFFGSNVRRTFTKAGQYTGTVAVRDDEGDVTTKAVTVTVTGTGRAPEIVEALADPRTGPAPLEVLFQAVADDPDGDPLTYKWEFGDVAGSAAFGAEVEHTYLTKGGYTAKLTVSDPAGNTDTAEIAITVGDPAGNRPPAVEAAAVPQSGQAPLDVQFSATGTDPDGDALTYKWSFGDGPGETAGRRARHVYTRNGVFTATVTATDRAGNTATDTIDITVGNPAGNQAPTVQAAADPASGTAPLTVKFSAAGHDPDGDAVSYVWTFGDGDGSPQAAGPAVTHTYAGPGTYTATVTVSDGEKTGTATAMVTVTAPQGLAGGTPQPRSAARTTLASVSAPKLATFRRSGLKVAATCGADGTAAAALWASKATARKLGLTSRGFGRATMRCTAGRTVAVRLKPTRKVRRAIRAKKPSSLRITVALALQDGALLKRTVTIVR